MAIENQCTGPPEGLEIPTLRVSVDKNLCDRTDYGAVDEMSQRTGTSERMYAEAESYLQELVDVDKKFNLGSDQAELKKQSDLEARMAYDLNQYRLASPGVFQIESKGANSSTHRSLGTGFAVASDGKSCEIVTDYHVVMDDSNQQEPGLSIETKDGKRSSARVKMLDPKTDLALLSTPIAEIGSCPILPLATEAENLKPGYDRVTAIGHPGSSDNQFISGGNLIRIDRKHSEINDHSDGKIKPWKENVVGEVNAHVFGGYSGGPAMANGEVVGATQYRRGDYEMFFTPVEDIHSLLTMAKDADGPISCDYARSKVKERIASGERHSGSYTGLRNKIRSEHTFTDGTTYIIDEITGSCEKVTEIPTG